MLFEIDHDEPQQRRRSGGVHDLGAILDEVLRVYFPSERRLPIQWGKRSPARRRSSIRLGSYDPVTSVIRIHPSLDHPLVPRYFIASIIHHEYLHHLLGPRHNRRFHHHERRFTQHSEARGWLRRNLAFLLGRPSGRSRAAAAARPAEQLALF